MGKGDNNVTSLCIPIEEVLKSLNEISWSLLKLINKSPNLSLNEIRRSTNLSQDKCYKELSRLEGGALITTNRDSADLRVIGYRISEYGIAALEISNN